jgi:hypothetical protein
VKILLCPSTALPPSSPAAALPPSSFLLTCEFAFPC